MVYLPRMVGSHMGTPGSQVTPSCANTGGRSPSGHRASKLCFRPTSRRGPYVNRPPSAKNTAQSHSPPSARVNSSCSTRSHGEGRRRRSIRTGRTSGGSEGHVREEALLSRRTQTPTPTSIPILRPRPRHSISCRNDACIACISTGIYGNPAAQPDSGRVHRSVRLCDRARRTLAGDRTSGRDGDARP